MEHIEDNLIFTLREYYIDLKAKGLSTEKVRAEIKQICMKAIKDMENSYRQK